AQLRSDAVTQVGTPPPAEAVGGGGLHTVVPDKTLTQGQRQWRQLMPGVQGQVGKGDARLLGTGLVVKTERVGQRQEARLASQAVDGVNTEQRAVLGLTVACCQEEVVGVLFGERAR